MDMQDIEKTVSGCIRHHESWSASMPEGEYIIRDKYGQGWGIPTKNITPDDLRAMADHLEKRLADT